jgi:hypothetical protein
MIPRSFLFHFSAACPYVETLWTAKGTSLDESHRLPDFSALKPKPAETSSGRIDFRMGWNEKGLAFSLRVEGRRRLPWCRTSRPEESEGVQLCLDTRDIRNVHRASRFCHRLLVLPGGSGPNSMNPSILWLPINRAKAHPNPVNIERLKIGGQITDTFYRLDFVLPSDTLTGYEPLEHSRLGLHYYIVDQDIGNRAFLLDTPFPHSEDPSLWAAVDLLPKI